jgi:hypothetical protein
MAHVISSLRARNVMDALPAPPRKVAAKAQETKTASPEKIAAAPQAPAAAPETPDFRKLFTGTVTPEPATPPATKPSPIAQSVFGPNVWAANPTGIAPNGQQYSYNPFYFATAETAAKVAQMAGGSVVQANMFTGNGGVFSQQQPNYMVQMSDGRLINPGLVASFYTHGYSQSYIDQMLASEFKA